MKFKKQLAIMSLTLTLIFISSFLLFQMYIAQSQPMFKVSGKQGRMAAKKNAYIFKKTLPTKTTATLVGIGDILIHSTVYNNAKTQTGYNFKPMLREVKPFIENADIAIANQETILGGTGIGLSTYPNFNSPFEIGDALKYVGIDIVSMANNHTLDRGELAIQNAIQHWNELGIAYTGSYLNAEDKQLIRTRKVNDITFSFLAYTYGTNGIPVPKGKEYLVNLINLENIKEEINLAKSLSDVVVVSLHFGNEYQRLPNDSQKSLVRELANSGADIILGHHPHVLQPTEWIQNNTGKKTFVIYSLGNFLSGQKGIYREIGGIVRLDVEKTTIGNQSSIKIKNPTFLPTYVSQTGYTKFKVVPLKEIYSSNLNIYYDIYTHMTQWMPDLKIIN